ncbi:hypothetical protein [Candidatus Methanomethylophilus sp. 1R26]|nr:hypothetical protein [Candidatus Methanomethylophilus sp. 1R26]
MDEGGGSDQRESDDDRAGRLTAMTEITAMMPATARPMAAHPCSSGP